MKKTEAYSPPSWMTLQKIRSLLNLNSYTESPASVFIDPLFADIMKLAKTRTEAWGGELYFVYLPEFSRYSNLVDHDLYRKKSEVIGLVKSLNISVIDIHEEMFSEHPDPLSLFPFRIHGHYTAEGYHQVAESIMRNIQKR